MTKVASWGRLSNEPHAVHVLADRTQVARQLGAAHPGVARGMGRSYGDASLNPGGVLWATRGLDHFIHLDEESGLLTCEAGVLLRDIQRMALPRGWMLPVTPGTQLVTVGGAIAHDVHGKNHHVLGSFADHVRRLTLVRTDGSTLVCGPQESADWFAATAGGFGMTGVITDAVIQLRRVQGPWLQTETIPYANLDEFFALADISEADWEHTVSWIDCASGEQGRGLFMRANPAPAMPERRVPREHTRGVPFALPFSPFNAWTLRAMNGAYFHLKKSMPRQALAHYQSFFYPLDNLLEWNRLYGTRGFYQYQSVVPREHGRRAIGAMLREIAHSGEGSFLAVLKTFGAQESLGMMSFPRPGVTLALDFPNRGAATERLFRRLDAIVAQAGGRLYLAKDARMPRALFEAGYPRLQEFLRYRDPGISSAMSRRLLGS